MINNNLYHLVHISQKEERISNGFKGGNYSADGQWIIGDKGDRAMQSWINFDYDSLPQYMKDLGIATCCLEHEAVLEIIKTTTETPNGSSGWTYMEEE
jgi:hypothetical protein